MRSSIALVCPYSLDQPGGVAQHILGFARWLRRAGQNPFVIAPGTIAQEEEFPVYLLGESVSLPFNGSKAQLALAPQQVRRALRLAGQADVVHVHEPLTPGVAYAVARTAKRLVVTHHASYALWLARTQRWRSKRLQPRAAFAVSEVAAQTARAATGYAVEVVANGVEMPTRVVDMARTTVVFLGRRDDPRKGYATFGHLARSLPDVDFVAMGPGKRHEPGVQELGQVSEEEKILQLTQARVLLAPHTFGESFGIVLLEALAQGCMVVGYGLPAFRQVVDDPRVSRWVPVGDEAALRAALIEMLNCKAAPEIAVAAAAKFSWDVVGPRVLKSYLAAMA